MPYIRRAAEQLAPVIGRCLRSPLAVSVLPHVPHRALAQTLASGWVIPAGQVVTGALTRMVVLAMRWSIDGAYVTQQLADTASAKGQGEKEPISPLALWRVHW